MPTDKNQPLSTNKRIDELRQLLNPGSGLSNSESLFLHDVIEQVVSLFTQTDGKERHFLTFVFTRESMEDYPLISTDTVSSLSSRGYALSLVEEWVARTKADGGK